MTDLVHKIDVALDEASGILERFQPGKVDYTFKQGDDPVTLADRTVDEYLRSTLPADGEGWLSEETADNEIRLSRRRVWIVDPLDGTREFVTGIPEFCVSIALIASATR
jgi:myo-inositol-1(or 4)-monophosphatase